jgi:hypothetical protein
MAEIRGTASEIVQTATSRLASRALAFEARRHRMRTLTAAGSGVLFCLLLAAGFAISRASARGRRLLHAVRESQRRTREIRDLLHTTLTSIREG